MSPSRSTWAWVLWILGIVLAALAAWIVLAGTDQMPGSGYDL